jgi:hypothetical protein
MLCRIAKRLVPQSNVIVIAAVVLAASFLLAGTHSADATSRGLQVTLKASEAPQSATTGSVRLYGASYALVIGNDNYTGGWPKLSNAVNDAELIAAELEKRGFDVTLKRNLTAAALKQTFEEFYVVKGADPNARLFVWFAGHGHTVGAEGFLVPVDAPDPDRSAAAATQFRLKSLSLRRFGEFVRLAQSKHAYTVFDACFAGTVFNSQRAKPPPAITHATTLPVRQFLTSGDKGQTVSDDGTFRKLFLRAIKGEARADANGDGFLTASELGLFITDRYTNISRTRQTPRSGKLADEDYDRGDFVFKLAAVALTSKPPKVSGFTLDDLKRQEAARAEWGGYQTQMATAYDQVTSFKGVPPARRAAYDRFLKTFAANNPHTKADDILRTRVRRQRLTIKSQTATVAPVPRTKLAVPSLNTSFNYPLTSVQKFQYMTKLFNEIPSTIIPTNNFGRLGFASGVPKKYRLSAATIFKKLISDAVNSYGDSHAKYSGIFDFKVLFKTALASLRGQQPDTLFVEFEAPGFCGSSGCTTHIIFNNGNIWNELGTIFGCTELTVQKSKSNGFRDIVCIGTKSGSIYQYIYDGHHYLEHSLKRASVTTSQPSDKTSTAKLSPSKIVIRAVIDSWIQVRDIEANQLVATKLLRHGDTYFVPARSGLTLLTGNAGALEIEVDGKVVPSIGPVGTVRRNVSLDAKKLLNGTAILQ